MCYPYRQFTLSLFLYSNCFILTYCQSPIASPITTLSSTRPFFNSPAQTVTANIPVSNYSDTTTDVNSYELNRDGLLITNRTDMTDNEEQAPSPEGEREMPSLSLRELDLMDIDPIPSFSKFHPKIHHGFDHQKEQEVFCFLDVEDTVEFHPRLGSYANCRPENFVCKTKGLRFTSGDELEDEHDDEHMAVITDHSGKTGRAVVDMTCSHSKWSFVDHYVCYFISFRRFATRCVNASQCYGMGIGCTFTKATPTWKLICVGLLTLVVACLIGLTIYFTCVYCYNCCHQSGTSNIGKYERQIENRISRISAPLEASGYENMMMEIEMSEAQSRLV